MYVTGEMDLLSETDRQIRFAWIEQANWIRNCLIYLTTDIGFA